MQFQFECVLFVERFQTDEIFSDGIVREPDLDRPDTAFALRGHFDAVFVDRVIPDRKSRFDVRNDRNTLFFDVQFEGFPEFRRLNISGVAAFGKPGPEKVRDVCGVADRQKTFLISDAKLLISRLDPRFGFLFQDRRRRPGMAVTEPSGNIWAGGIVLFLPFCRIFVVLLVIFPKRPNDLPASHGPPVPRPDRFFGTCVFFVAPSRL